MNKNMIFYLVLFLSPFHAWANLEQIITFTGEIKAASCQMSAVTGGRTVAMSTDGLTTLDFRTRDFKAITPFEISLTNCVVPTGTTKTVNVIITPPATATVTADKTLVNLERTTGTGANAVTQLKNLGLGIRKRNENTALKLDSGEKSSFPLSNGTVTLRFDAFLQRSSTAATVNGDSVVTEGSFSQPLNFVLEYP